MEMYNLDSREIEENKENLPKTPLNPEGNHQPIYETEYFVVSAYAVINTHWGSF